MPDIKTQCLNMIDKAADEVFDAEKIQSYLNVAAHCYGHPYYNQLLAWKQKGNVTDICGVKAWKSRGRDVIQGEKPIVVLNSTFTLGCPGIPKKDDNGNALVEESTGVPIWVREPEWGADFKAVPVFDITQTEGNDIVGYIPDISILNDVIRKNMGLCVVEADATDLPAYQSHMYDEEKKILTIKKGMTDREKDHEALSFLITYRATNYGKDVPDNLNALITFSLYIFEVMLNMQQKNVIRGMADQMKNLSLEDKKRFLEMLNHFVKEIIIDVFGLRLDFAETSYINNLLDTDDKEMIPVSFETVCRSMRDDNPETADGITGLYRDKVMRATPGSIERLYMDKWHMEVFSFPAYPLEIQT